MDQCVSGTLSLFAPIVLFNFIGTFSGFIIALYVDRVLWNSDEDSSDSSSESDDSKEFVEADVTDDSKEFIETDITDDNSKRLIEAEVTDDDLIASVRRSVLDNSTNLEQNLADIVQKASDVLKQDGNVPVSKKEAIIAIVQKTLNLLDNDNCLSTEKQQTITSILDDIPNIVDKMKIENNSDLQVLSEEKATEVGKLTSEQESKYLMKTLDALQ